MRVENTVLVIKVVWLVGSPGQTDHWLASVNIDKAVLLEAVGEPEIEILALSRQPVLSHHHLKPESIQHCPGQKINSEIRI